MKNPITINYADLVREGACESGLRRFRKIYGKSITIPDWNWRVYLDMRKIWEEDLDWMLGLGLVEIPSFAGGDLQGVRFSSAYLPDANFTGADLAGADLIRANLRDADMRDADMRDADLRRADMRGARLGGADMRGVDMRGARLAGADMRGAKFTEEVE